MNAAKEFSTLSNTLNFVYVSGEGIPAKPGRLTPLFAQIKGRTEKSLLELQEQYPSLKVFNMRPAGVDSTYQPVIHPFLPKDTNIVRKIAPVLFPVMRATLPGHVSPTKELGEFLVDLAMGDGKPLEGPNIEAGGRTISNKAFRRIMGFQSGV